MKNYFLVLFILLCTSASLYSADNMPFSQEPPGGISVADAPMFVSLGWDDNSYSDGLKWIRDYTKNLKNRDGSNVRMTFFNTANRGMSETVLATEHQNAQDVVNAWSNLYYDGHEIGNHSLNHPHGSGITESGWTDQINDCNDFLSNTVGVPASQVYGFRTPFLEYGAGTFEALRNSSFVYDCSIEFGFDGWSNPDGTWNSMVNPETHKNLFWPHTLDAGSPPGNSSKVNGSTFPGLWEFMVYTLLRKNGQGVITGFDFNVFNQATNYNGEQALELWRYNFDLHREGNKCPFTLNVHTDYYSDWNTEAVTAFPASTVQTRREAIEGFIDYVISFDDVRVVPFITILNWMNDPVSSSEYVAPNLLETGGTAVKHNANMVKESNVINCKKKGMLELNISVAGTYSLDFYSLNGKKYKNVFSGILNNGKYLYDLKDLDISKGIYIAKINGIKNGQVKFIKE